MKKAKDISNYDGAYKIIPKGAVLSCLRTSGVRSKKYKPIQIYLGRDGYNFVRLSKNNIAKNHRVHRLVAKTFIPNPENKKEVNHKNGIKTDNRAENLEWVTRSENRKHAFRIGIDNQSCEANNCSKLTNNEVLQIRSLIEHGWFTQKEIADSYNVDPSLISKIKNNHNWAL